MGEAARVGDDHKCPMTNPNSSPHNGGPIMAAGKPTVFIGGMPAANVNNKCVCAGPVDTILKGSRTVKIMGAAAVRKNDPTSHGGIIKTGCSNVKIGG